LSIHNAVIGADAASVDGLAAAEQAVDLMLSITSDGLDHPELWALLPALVGENRLIPNVLERRASVEPHPQIRTMMQLLCGLSIGVIGGPRMALDLLLPLSATESQNVQVQGALFHLEGQLDPGNPKYQLEAKVCLNPFKQLDVLDGSTHMCCASWLPASVGNLHYDDWQAVWNGATAQKIRASMLDGSYRYCNKRTCPYIQGNKLTPIAELEADPHWSEIMTERQTHMLRGPETMNLSYDRTCNLSCPSCRSTRYAADDATRDRYTALQERAILPLLKQAKTVYVTGSGDPFASKNFRRLMEQLTEADYPALKFIVMTNGMLFTPRQWEAFPALHGRVESLRISVDAATGPTHELLRRGARWPVMLENMKFAGTLKAAGLVDDYMLTCTVQKDNYREMGDMVDLAREMGCSSVYFGRVTNWGTFSTADYQDKAVFVPGHPEYDAFVEACRDPRLRDPMVWPSDLDEFINAA